MKKSTIALSLALAATCLIYLSFRPHPRENTTNTPPLRHPNPSPQSESSPTIAQQVTTRAEESLQTVPHTASSSPFITVGWQDPRDWSDAIQITQTRTIPNPNAPNQYRRIRIVSTAGFSFPIRLTENVSIDPNSGEETVVLDSAVAANQILVHSHNALDQAAMADLAQALGWQVKASTRSPYLAVLSTPNFGVDTVEFALEAIAQSSSEFKASPNHIFYAAAVPNDPSYQQGEQWALNHPDDNDIDAPEGWDTRTSAADITIAITDSGVRLDHEDLKQNLWKNPGEIPGNGIDDDQNGYIDDIHGINAIEPNKTPDDDNGHGTHVAGIAGAVGNNSKGVAGVAWSVKLMALKCLNQNGQGAIDGIVEAIDYAIDQDVDIINASWGAYAYSAALEEAIERADTAGILFVAAAGNYSVSAIIVPAVFPFKNIVSVGSTDQDGTKSSFSNYNWIDVDVVAPGSKILSTWNETESSYAYLSGTSMATPIVSGVLALNLAQHPDDDIYTQIERLKASVDKHQHLVYSSATSGIVNLDTSLRMDRIPSLPTITDSSLQEATILEGESATFSVTAESDIEISYQWFHDGTELVGETDATIEIENALTERRGTYTVQVSNDDGFIEGTFTLNVYPRMRDIETALNSSIPVYVSHESHWEIIHDNSLPDSPYVAATERAPSTKIQMILAVPSDGLLNLDNKSLPHNQSGIVSTISNNYSNTGFSVGEWGTSSFSFPWTGPNRITIDYGSRNPNITAPAGGLALDNLTFFKTELAPPFFTRHPNSRALSRFASISLLGEAFGTNLTYQWYKDDSAIDGATTNRLDIPSVSENEVGDYYLVATNSFGSARSNSATIETNDSPVAALILDDSYLHSNLSIGDTVTLERNVVGDLPITYQWFKGDYLIPGQTTPSLTLGPVNETHSGNYFLEVSNEFGTQRSSAHLIAVNPAVLNKPPYFSKPSEDVHIVTESGTGHVFMYPDTPESVGPFSYQWYKDDIKITSNFPAGIYSLTSPTLEDAGTYYAEITNSFGTVKSKNFIVEVLPGIAAAIETDDYLTYSNSDYTTNQIRVRSQTETTRDGIDAAEFIHDGQDPLSSSIQVLNLPLNTNFSLFWKTDGNPETHLTVNYAGSQIGSLAGDGNWQEFKFYISDTSSSLEISLLSTNGSQRAWVDQLSPTNAPFVYREITHDIPVLGSSVTIQAEITGPNLTLQWYKNGTPIDGATESQLEIDSFAAADAGSYRLIGTNANGSAETTELQIDARDSFLNDFATNIDLATEDAHLIDSSQFDPSNQNKRFIHATLPTDVTASFDATVQGPGTLVVDYQNDAASFTVAIGENLYSSAGSLTRRLSAFPIPEGTHPVSIAFTGNLDSSEANLYSVQFQSDPIITKQASYYGIQIQKLGENALPYIETAGAEPLTIEWYKDGQLLSTLTNQLSGSHSLLSRAPQPSDEGTYKTIVTDATGNTIESEPMGIGFLQDFSAVLDAPVDSVSSITPNSKYDYQDYVAGNSSLSIAGPFSAESNPVKFSASIKSIWIKAINFAPSATLQVSTYQGHIKELPIPSKWTQVDFPSDSILPTFHLPANDNPESRILFDNISPNPLDRTRFITHPFQHATFLGDTVSLRAQAYNQIDGITIRWTKDGVPIQGGEDGFLQIRNLRASDLGSYRAIAVESTGRETASNPAPISLLSQDFANAIDMPGARISTWGDALWQIDKTQSFNGSSSLRSGSIEDGQESSIKIEIDGPAASGYYYRGIGSDSDGLDKEEDWTFKSQDVVSAGESRSFTIQVTESTNETPEQKQKAIAWIDRLIVSPVTSSSFADWQDEIRRSYTTPLSDQSLHRLSDPDGDANPNWLEFALGLDPFASDLPPAFGIEHFPNSAPKAEILYSIARSEDHFVSFEASFDLQHWFAVKPSLTLIDSTVTHEKFRAQIYMPNSDEPTYFIRWSVRLKSDQDAPSPY